MSILDIGHWFFPHDMVPVQNHTLGLSVHCHYDYECNEAHRSMKAASKLEVAVEPRTNLDRNVEVGSQFKHVARGSCCGVLRRCMRKSRSTNAAHMPNSPQLTAALSSTSIIRCTLGHQWIHDCSMIPHLFHPCFTYGVHSMCTSALQMELEVHPPHILPHLIC